jgi:hypothetical protein
VGLYIDSTDVQHGFLGVPARRENESD